MLIIFRITMSSEAPHYPSTSVIVTNAFSYGLSNLPDLSPFLRLVDMTWAPLSPRMDGQQKEITAYGLWTQGVGHGFPHVHEGLPYER
jgi:hypothetical protein